MNRSEGAALVPRWCESQPLAEGLEVQPFAFVLAGPRGAEVIEWASAAPRWMGEAESARLLGRELREVVQGLRRGLCSGLPGLRTYQSICVPAVSGEQLEGTFTVNETCWVLAVEEPSGIALPGVAQMTEAMQRVGGCSAIEDLARESCTVFRELSGYDRVMMYRFHADGHGEVVGEARQPELEPYLGLHYPASDIPESARALYLEERMRLLVDARVPMASLRGSPGAGIHPDLRHCPARALAPTHLQYLRNMGVCGTFVTSLVVDGALWGLIACHHGSARRPCGLHRELLLGLTEHIAAEVQGVELTMRSRRRSALDLHARRLQAGLERMGSRTRLDDLLRQEIAEPLAAEQVLVVSPGEGRDESVPGSLPDSVLEPLEAWLASRSPEAGALLLETPPEALRDALLPRYAGMACVRLPGVEGDSWLVALRAPWPHRVRWGGDPGQAYEEDPETGEISPRRSFAAWTHERRGRSRPWTPEEVGHLERVAELLAHGMLRADQRRTSRELLETRARAEAVLRAVPDLLFVLGLDGRILDFHAQDATALYASPAAFLGRSFREVLPEPARGLLMGALEDLGAGASVLDVRYPLDMPAGSRSFHARIARLSGSEAVAMVRDVTEQEADRVRLLEALEAVRKANMLFTAAGRLARLGHWEVFTDERLPVWSEETYRIHGLEPGTPVTLAEAIAFYVPEDRPLVSSAVEEAVGERVPFRFQARIRTQAAEVRWVESTGEPVLDAAGAVGSIRGVIRDITEQQVLMEEVLERDARLRALLEHVPGVLFQLRVDACGKHSFSFIGGQLRALFPSLVGKAAISLDDVLSCVDAADRAKLSANLEQIISLRTTGEFEYRVEHPERGLVWVRTAGAMTLDPEGTGGSVWTGLTTDISSQRALREREIQNARRKATEALARGIVHDFNNYLMAMIAEVQLLEEERPTGEELLERLGDLRRHLHEAGVVARQLQAFTRDQPIKPVTLVVSEFLRECMTFALRGSAIKAVVRVPEDDLQVVADEGLLRQVLFNLLLNARQLMQDQGGLWASAGVEPDENGRLLVAIRVRDDGPGVPLHVADTLFNAYMTQREGGTGLGLYVARTFMERMGGGIRLTNAGEPGAEFLVYLPTQPDPELWGRALTSPRVLDSLKSGNWRAIAAPSSSEEPGERCAVCQVWLLEDDPRQRDALSRLLRRRGLSVHGFADGRDLVEHAWTSADSGRSVACVMDVMVSGGAGALEIVDEVRRVLPEARLVLVSGFSERLTQWQQRLQELNVRFIGKPFDINDLMGALSGDG
ncbi:MAG: GAF domain-containing protein [Deltaproteobacteria bacterium]|nr:MAG: GAF domain-containing protein [Deltaproteobacteria bacterium]